MRKLQAVMWLTCCLLMGTLLPAFAQGGTTQYIYDSNGRLSGVIAPSGSAAVYKYDAAGNLLSIEQIAAGGFSVLSFSPQVGTVGDQVTLTGVGMDTATTVLFNGTPAQVVSASANSLVVTVPAGASTGLITLSGVRGTATTPSDFTVVAKVLVTPALAEILPGETVAFTASVVGTADQTVTWVVDGIAGGDVTVGTIDATGLYQSPATDTGLTVVVSAASELDTAVTGAATVRILNPNNASEVHSNGVSVGLGVVPSLAPTAGPVSVQIGFLGALQAPEVMVEVGNSVASPSLPLSVQYGLLADFQAAPVSATTGPVIAAISPATLVRGSTTDVTISGQNLGGTTSISFLKATGSLEQNIAISNLLVSTDGTTLTFTAAVASLTAVGTDTVYVTASNGRSTMANSGGNTIQVQ